MRQPPLPIPGPVNDIYGTRSSRRWRETFADPLNMSMIFAHEGRYGMPLLRPSYATPTTLAAWHDKAAREAAKRAGGALHCFLDDHRFEMVWNIPQRGLERAQDVGMALSPDFSVWRDMPVAMQMWQVYRSRWVGAYWQAHGVEVIPTVTWGTRDTFEFCFDGLPAESTLAVGCVGLRERRARVLFQDGLRELEERLRPSELLLYGALPDGVSVNVPTCHYETFWDIRRAEIEHGRAG